MVISKDFVQLVKYILVGIFNTIFGIGLYTVVILLLGESHYLLLGFICNIIAITQAFLFYKLFVFKTKGNYLAEYLRTYITNGTSMFTGLVMMYILVSLLKISAIYANIIVTGITVVINFFMHKGFTFKKI